jgi:hypothetical protein
VAPFWDDLDFILGGSAYRYSNNSDSLVISYISVPHFNIGGPYTFQIIILSDGTITFQYQTINEPSNSATVGIQNANGSVGLQVVYNDIYLHNNLAIRITPSWLRPSPTSGTIIAGEQTQIAVTLDAGSLTAGTYTGTIVITSNDPDTPTINVPVTLLVGEVGPVCTYVFGDANGIPPFNGIDITYSVNYLKGLGPMPPDTCNCPPHGLLFAAADANGSCQFNGIDVSYSVNYLKGIGPAPAACPDCPPSGARLLSPPNVGGREATE